MPVSRWGFVSLQFFSLLPATLLEHRSGPLGTIFRQDRTQWVLAQALRPCTLCSPPPCPATQARARWSQVLPGLSPAAASLQKASLPSAEEANTYLASRPRWRVCPHPALHTCPLAFVTRFRACLLTRLSSCELVNLLRPKSGSHFFGESVACHTQSGSLGV